MRPSSRPPAGGKPLKVRQPGMVYKATPSVSKSVHGVNWPLTVREIEIVVCGVRPGEASAGQFGSGGGCCAARPRPATPIVAQDRHYESPSVGVGRVFGAVGELAGAPLDQLGV